MSSEKKKLIRRAGSVPQRSVTRSLSKILLWIFLITGALVMLTGSTKFFNLFSSAAKEPESDDHEKGLVPAGSVASSLALMSPVAKLSTRIMAQRDVGALSLRVPSTVRASSAADSHFVGAIAQDLLSADSSNITVPFEGVLLSVLAGRFGLSSGDTLIINVDALTGYLTPASTGSISFANLGDYTLYAWGSGDVKVAYTPFNDALSAPVAVVVVAQALTVLPAFDAFVPGSAQRLTTSNFNITQPNATVTVVETRNCYFEIDGQRVDTFVTANINSSSSTTAASLVSGEAFTQPSFIVTIQANVPSVGLVTTDEHLYLLNLNIADVAPTVSVTPGRVSTSLTLAAMLNIEVPQSAQYEATVTVTNLLHANLFFDSSTSGRSVTGPIVLSDLESVYVVSNSPTQAPVVGGTVDYGPGNTKAVAFSLSIEFEGVPELDPDSLIFDVRQGLQTVLNFTATMAGVADNDIIFDGFTYTNCVVRNSTTNAVLSSVTLQQMKTGEIVLAIGNAANFPQFSFKMHARNSQSAATLTADMKYTNAVGQAAPLTQASPPVVLPEDGSVVVGVDMFDVRAANGTVLSSAEIEILAADGVIFLRKPLIGGESKAASTDPVEVTKFLGSEVAVQRIIMQYDKEEGPTSFGWQATHNGVTSALRTVRPIHQSVPDAPTWTAVNGTFLGNFEQDKTFEIIFKDYVFDPDSVAFSFARSSLNGTVLEMLWDTSNGKLTGSLRQVGEYAIELVVTDETVLSSSPQTFFFTVTPAPTTEPAESLWDGLRPYAVSAGWTTLVTVALSLLAFTFKQCSHRCRKGAYEKLIADVEKGESAYNLDLLEFVYDLNTMPTGLGSVKKTGFFYTSSPAEQRNLLTASADLVRAFEGRQKVEVKALEPSSQKIVRKMLSALIRQYVVWKPAENRNKIVRFFARITTYFLWYRLRGSFFNTMVTVDGERITKEKQVVDQLLLDLKDEPLVKANDNNALVAMLLKQMKKEGLVVKDDGSLADQQDPSFSKKSSSASSSSSSSSAPGVVASSTPNLGPIAQAAMREAKGSERPSGFTVHRNDISASTTVRDIALAQERSLSAASLRRGRNTSHLSFRQPANGGSVKSSSRTRGESPFIFRPNGPHGS